jgi:hypothetical protein
VSAPLLPSDFFRKKRPTAFDLTGQRYGNLLVLGYAGYVKKARETQWLCECDCGERKVYSLNNLRAGHVYSCGCARWRVLHGASDTPTYSSWKSMRWRCGDKKNKYYGGRGITVCERWNGRLGFVNFLADMGKRPSGKTLDRINPDGNYEPTNCRWADDHEQRWNQRRCQPEPQPAADAGDTFGVDAPF